MRDDRRPAHGQLRWIGLVLLFALAALGLLADAPMVATLAILMAGATAWSIGRAVHREQPGGQDKVG
ncbi:MAG: hypothetical protein HOY71_14895 [Nonomuraea sp.]|nr:hypothetical protein [Nonomuraea sp.]